MDDSSAPLSESPFVRFRPYNTRASASAKRSAKRYRILTTSANRFKCLGKLDDRVPPKAPPSDRSVLSFAEFKKIEAPQKSADSQGVALSDSAGTPTDESKIDSRSS